MKKRMMKICYMMTLAAVLCTSGTIGATGIKSVYAAENEVQGRAATTNGILNLNNGPASITIKGNDGQSLKGKRFLVYQLFHAENAKGMESINYTFNPEYKKFVCYIVGQRIHKDERNVTEYDVIDYIQSLNTHQTEGAQTAQEKEGAYSEYRVFVEELRTHLQRNGKTGQSVLKYRFEYIYRWSNLAAMLDKFKNMGWKKFYLMYAMCTLGTMATRFLPFMIFNEKRTTLKYITYLGRVLPGAIFSMLIVYCLKNVNVTSYSYGLPELIAIIVTVLLHKWKRQMLVSIAGGTICYMLLVQLVFR